METDAPQDTQTVDPPPAVPTDAGPPAPLVEVVSGEVVEGPERNGLFGTWVPGVVALLLAIAALLDQLGTIDWSLDWPTLFGVLIPVLTTQGSKVLQALAKIRAQG